MEHRKNQEGWVRAVSPVLSPPSLKDNTGDTDRLLKGLRKAMDAADVRIPFSLIKTLSETLRRNDFRVTAILYEDGGAWHLVDVRGREKRGGPYGASVDLGSSTVVVRILDLAEGRILAESSFHNPQIQIGTDILTRIHFAAREGGLEKLQGLVRDRLNEELSALGAGCGIPEKGISALSMAGNTTMTHLFLGLDPYGLCREPYIPVVNRAPVLKARDLGVAIHPEGPVLIFPNVGSYFGGDLIAGILASGMTRHHEVSMLVDVGTNAEVVIGNDEWLMGCAGAAGPALEGGVADMGMMAGPGVIDRVSIDPDSGEFRIHTIGDQPPVGICGSGLIDLAAQLFLAGMVDLRGKFVPERCGNRLIRSDGVSHLVVVPEEESAAPGPLTLAQTDLDGLIRSKAAMYTILTTITNTVGIPFDALNRFYVAGTFGSYIDPASAVTIGMIPDLPLDTYVSVGNTSLEGATRALLRTADRDEALSIRDRITYLELNVNQEFMNLFSAAKFLPHTNVDLFPSVRNRIHGTVRS
ncbi:MAG: DUF4445 domain-containing protein [Deltaproteobacteria bacterium]|nr:DUF4445 domain-containing protein [Deltaproteobacteria bacterium]MBW1923087.1 DUF4445 domain-containing protein [Deltaproteobacteria bacterium]MBW1949778.1 DUF4445 domain-containing protein [Deltaproteobacteria bacterium]MBW2008370.1 DUF4445 domain-containing protein [Deltaproteobacteria bacterium]MBW2102199.1 DUF4445 domain-containing protein [Deltaproteobacteria bacterium]